MRFEGSGGQRLGSDVGDHILCRNVGDCNCAVLLLFTCIVVSQVDVLGGGAMSRIVGHSNSTLAVGEQVNRPNELKKTQAGIQAIQPFSFLGCLGCATVLGMIRARSDVGVKL